MIIRDEPAQRTQNRELASKLEGLTHYGELTPQQHQAGLDFLAETPLSAEYSSEDFTWIKLIAATASQKAAFRDAIS